MNTATRPRMHAASLDLQRAARGLLATGLLSPIGCALAQTGAQSGAAAAPSLTGDPAARSSFMVVFERLDAVALGVGAIALLIITLLVWRIWLAVRRERPIVPQSRADRSLRAAQTRGDDDRLERNSISGPTDWGADQDKRASVGRAGVAGRGRNADRSAIEHQATLWPAIDNQSTLGQGVLPPDALGRAPVAPPSPYRTGGFNPYYHVARADHRIEVEEIADTLTQAELLVQLGDPKEAMSLLARHIRETEKPGPSVWLMLLGLYQSTGREAQYNALAEGFRTLFNAEVPPWASSSDVAARELESYPQVIKRLKDIWPRRDCRLFLESLLTDDRGGSRQGFTLAAYRELLFLVEILDALEQQVRETSDQVEIERKLVS